MKLNYLLRITLLISFFCNAQAPAIQWQKSYGGSNGESYNCVKQTSDGGYIMVGSTSSTDGDITSLNHGGGDILIVKTSATGIIQWQKTYGGTKGDTGVSVDFTSDGGYIIGSYTYSNDGDITSNHSINYTDCFIMKLSSNGILEWQKTYGGTDTERIYSIKSTPDGGYIFIASTYSNDGDVIGAHYTLSTNDIWVVKLSSTGTIQWQKCYGGSNTDGAWEILLTNDGGYIISGYTASNDGDVIGTVYGGIDSWVIKISSTGIIQWQKCYGGTAEDEFLGMYITSDGGYIFSGGTYSNNGNITGNFGYSDFWIVKTNSLGVIQWQKNYGGSLYEVPYGGIKQTNDGGYIIAGLTNSNNNNITGYHGGQDFWVLKISSTGVIQWQKCLGGTNMEIGYNINITNDNGYIVAGQSNSNDGDVTGNHGGTDAWIVKLAPDSLSNESFTEKTTITLFPNPAKENITLKLNYFTPSQEISITDIQGKIIHNQKLEGLSTTINTSSFAKGIYFLNLIDGTQKTIEKFIVE